jgi:glucosamine-6-phosphate deaminase
LLIKYPTDIVCLGIGENTHLAFNDPHVADFNDSLIVKVVDLDQDCRVQQVNDGCFKTIDEVPTHALTITMPALFKSTYAIAIVPGKFKANAIDQTINSEISEKYPSTILRRHDQAILFIDEDSASKL